MSATAVRTRELLSQKEVSEITGIAEPTLESWRCRKVNGPPFVRVSKGMIRYRRSDLDQWCEDRLVRPMQPTVK